MAYLVSQRSNDAQTKCGAVIVGKNNEILSTGYNGTIRNIDDNILPNLRPDKYMWMIHAEHNAILNCARNGIKLDGTTIYVTGPPCIYCLQYIYQVGISKIIHGSILTKGKYEENNVEKEIFFALTKDKLKIKEVDTNYLVED
jgi:dCMP deaminase